MKGEGRSRAETFYYFRNTKQWKHSRNSAILRAIYDSQNLIELNKYQFKCFCSTQLQVRPVHYPVKRRFISWGPNLRQNKWLSLYLQSPNIMHPSTQLTTTDRKTSPQALQVWLVWNLLPSRTVSGASFVWKIHSILQQNLNYLEILSLRFKRRKSSELT